MPKKCFVIMPMSRAAGLTADQWEAVYSDLIKPAVEESGFDLICEKSNAKRGTFVREVVQGLKEAYIVIADLSGQRPNVFYELGARHALSNRTIMIARDKKYIPSDLLEYYTILYDFPGARAKREFMDEMREAIQQIESNPEEPDSPISVYLQRRDLAVRDFTRDENLRRLTALRAEVTFHLLKVGKTIETLRKDPAAMERQLSVVALSKPALEAFIAEYFIPHPNLHLNALNINDSIERLLAFAHLPEIGPYRNRESLLIALAELSNYLEVFRANVAVVRSTYAGEGDLSSLELLEHNDTEGLVEFLEKHGFEVDVTATTSFPDLLKAQPKAKGVKSTQKTRERTTRSKRVAKPARKKAAAKRK